MTISLYRRYRPAAFEEVAGQTVAVDVIKKAVLSGRVGHAYLFSGPRGCGKTTMARLLAKALNCENLQNGFEPCGRCPSCLSITAGESLDVIEIDGASNNSVDEIRELKTHVSLSPFASKWKVYIIDEVHMLSISAFNALLKTLEEPPAFVAFILATTEPFKVPATIRSRCRHIPFRRITVKDITARLTQVAETEGAPFEESALREIARQADGALRDALSMMEQALSLGDGSLTMQAVDRLLGGGGLSDLERWVASAGEDSAAPFLIMEEMFLKGASTQRVVEGLFLLFRNLWAWRKWGDKIIDSLSISESEADFLKSEGPGWTAPMLSEMMLFCSRLIPQVRSGLRSDVLTGVLAAKIQELRAPSPAEEKPSRPRKAAAPAAPEAPKTERPAMPAMRPSREDRTAPGEAKPAAPAALGPENWPGFEEMLFSRDLLLYSLLAGTEIAMEERIVTVIFPEDPPYSYELASIERTAYSLAARVSEYFGEDAEVVIEAGSKKKKCASNGGRGEAPPAEAHAVPMFSPPEDDGEADKRDEGPGGTQPAASGAACDEGIPFQNLVDEVLRWGGGEVVMIRRDGASEDLPDDPLGVDE